MLVALVTSCATCLFPIHFCPRLFKFSNALCFNMNKQVKENSGFSPCNSLVQYSNVLLKLKYEIRILLK